MKAGEDRYKGIREVIIKLFDSLESSTFEERLLTLDPNIEIDWHDGILVNFVVNGTTYKYAQCEDILSVEFDDGFCIVFYKEKRVPKKPRLDISSKFKFLLKAIKYHTVLIVKDVR